MPVTITLDELQLLAPNARSSYREGFQKGQAILDKAGVSASPLRTAHFMAQVLHESGGLAIQFENLNYSPERLPKVWPSRFKPAGPLDPALYAHDPQKLANEVYNGRMGNTGNDGYTFRGRGLLQTTGREGYRDLTKVVRQFDPTAPDFEANPDEVISANWCLAVAAAEWLSSGCNGFADADDIRKVTKAINGAYIGLPERTEWLKRTKAVWK